MIESGKIDVAIAGGTESTNTDFVRTALESISLAEPGNHASDGTGFTVSEGAVFLILEDVERAARRGAGVYARIGAFAMANAPCETDGYGSDPDALVRTMRGALSPQASGITSVGSRPPSAPRMVRTRASGSEP
ncbi:hypothetical protein FE88_32005 [Azospirillum brasilense]|nr:hypothetical protein FE88_32005 [Azospirillum brasilense]